MFLLRKQGFIVYGEFIPINGKGHENTAMEIIRKNFQNEFFSDSNLYKDQKDFLIFKKNAIQVGGAGDRCIIYNRNAYSYDEAESVSNKFGIHGYKHYPWEDSTNPTVVNFYDEEDDDDDLGW